MTDALNLERRAYKRKPAISTAVLLFVATVLTATFAAQSSVLLGQAGGDSGGQSSSSSSASSATTLTLEDIQRLAAAKQWEEREAKAEDLKIAMLQFGNTAKTYAITQEGLLNKLAVHRKECKDELRASSSVLKFSYAETCFAEDLALQLDLLEKEREYVGLLPNVREDIKLLALTRIDLLKDAVNVVRNAIENQVYGSIEELEEVKQAIATQYRMPKWTMDMRIRADQLLARTNNVILRIGTVLTATDADEAMVASLSESLACFTEAESLLSDAVRQVDYETVKTVYDQATAALSECANQAILSSEELNHPVDQGGAVEPSEGEVTEPMHGSAEEPSTEPKTGQTFRINGLTGNKYPEQPVDTGYNWKMPQGEQANGPTYEACDLSQVSRKLLNRMPKDENGNPICRIF